MKTYLKLLCLMTALLFNHPALAIFDNIFGSNEQLPVQKGEFVKIQKGRWRPAKILEIKMQNNIHYIRVTYVGLSTKEDEWVELSRAAKIN